MLCRYEPYHDFILAAADVSQDNQGLHGFSIRVVGSPLGKTEPDYVSKYVEPRLAWFTQQCGPEEPGSGGESGS